MFLTLKFYGNASIEKEPEGYIVIDNNKIIIGFLSKENTIEAQEESKEKRNLFANYLGEFVFSHLANPSLKSCSFGEDFSRKETDDYNLESYDSCIFLTFKQPITFMHFLVLLTHIPSAKLNSFITPDCLKSVMRSAREYFIEIFDETSEELISEEVFLSSSPSVSNLRFFDSLRKEKKNKEEVVAEEQSSRPKVFFFDHDSDKNGKTYKEGRQWATNFTEIAMSKDEKFRQEFFSQKFG